MSKTKTPRKTLPTGIGKVLKRLHYPLDVILLCVRWYVAYSLSLRNLEEMMVERGIEVDHSSVHRWVIKLLPVFEKAFRNRKRPVGKSWRVDETYVKVKGQWKYLYRAVDKAGNTVDFLLRARRDKAAARRGTVRHHFALKWHLLRASLYRKQLAARFVAWRKFAELAQNPSTAFRSVVIPAAVPPYSRQVENALCNAVPNPRRVIQRRDSLLRRPQEIHVLIQQP